MSTEKKFPDYADIQKLENLAWNGDYQPYASFYHQLAEEYSETVLLEMMDQYRNGRPW